ncbi:MAG: HD domain-containing protein [Clostridiales bacterium]|nr:HD domain-containing protein [Clostridiales bacterium]
MAEYHVLSGELQEKILADKKNHWKNPYACPDDKILRRDTAHDVANLWRPAFVRDIEKILHNPYYNRYSDKTQVLSGYKNDDISRRALHVQLVARIARNIGRMLGLNEDLIEAISLGHDIGHTPFGHAGERFLNEIYYAHTGRFFNNNVQSVRVLDKMVLRNMSLQVLDGVLCHNGEMELEKYQPVKLQGFDEFDARVEACYTQKEANKGQIPSTLEGCVMRISDIIAYLGKDRQDAIKIGILKDEEQFTNSKIGTTNAEIINNMIVNIIENSYGKPYLCMEKEYYDAFSRAKKENYEQIYQNSKVDGVYQEVEPMFERMYEELLKQAKSGDTSTIFYRHHVEYLQKINYYNTDSKEYVENTNPHQMVVDYIASMTDNYFLALYEELFPGEKRPIHFKGYF